MYVSFSKVVRFVFAIILITESRLHLHKILDSVFSKEIRQIVKSRTMTAFNQYIIPFGFLDFQSLLYLFHTIKRTERMTRRLELRPHQPHMLETGFYQ